MDRRKFIILTVLLLIVLVVIVDPVYAGPGGVIAKGFLKTWWGKLILLLLVIIFLPVIIYIKMREYFAVRKNKKILTRLGLANKDFNWLYLEKSVRNVVERVHRAWLAEDMELVCEYVSPWYWRNQQMVHLDYWKENNLKNVCHLRKVETIRPLYLEITNEHNLEGSKIVFAIGLEIEDYLMNRSSGKVVEGKEGYSSEEKIWIMQYESGNWILDDIRGGEYSLAFAKLPNIVPTILPGRLQQKS